MKRLISIDAFSPCVVHALKNRPFTARSIAIRNDFVNTLLSGRLVGFMLLRPSTSPQLLSISSLNVLFGRRKMANCTGGSPGCLLTDSKFVSSLAWPQVLLISLPETFFSHRQFCERRRWPALAGGGG